MYGAKDGVQRWWDRWTLCGGRRGSNVGMLKGIHEDESTK